MSAAPEGSGNQFALTVDDGFCDECVDRYLSLAEAGLSLTLCPNGTYASVWEPYVERVRDLLAAGRVQMCNHTFSHEDLTALPEQRIEEEIRRNEQWIQRTFGVTSRPWLRPPFGRHDARVHEVAGRLGFTRILMWNGSFGDSGPLAPEVLLGEAAKYLRPGAIVLAHANYPTAVRHFDQIQALIDERGLQPRTLAQLFGPQPALPPSTRPQRGPSATPPTSLPPPQAAQPTSPGSCGWTGIHGAPEVDAGRG